MKRIVTLDFLRGACIIVMVGIHCFSAVFDKSWIGTEEMTSRTLMDIFFLLGLAYLGGMTGLFLMVSMIAHTISINGQLRKGKPLKDVMMRQIAAGVLLIIFAVLVESTLGQYGFLGRIAYFDPFGSKAFSTLVADNLPRIFYRGFHFMTLHTIGFCIVVNTLIQWFLYKRKGEKKVSRNVKIYIGLMIGVVLLTPFIWNLADAIIPGYPFATYAGSTRMVQYPLEGVTTFPEFLLLSVLAPIAGQTEPLFPFLFISFIGVVVGMYLSMREPPRKLSTKGIKIGFILLVLGMVGIQFMWLLGIDSWTNLENEINALLKMKIWFPVLLFTTGGQLLLIFGLLRFVEFRGEQTSFAKKTKIVRRFGAASLTIFAIQWIDAFPRYILSLLPGVDVFGQRDGMMVSIAVMFVVIGMWDVILRLWTKAKLVGSFEWLFSQVLSLLGKIMFRSGIKEKRERWWYISRLDLFSDDKKIQWKDLSMGRSSEKGFKKDCRLCYFISIIGLFFFPIAFFAYFFTRKIGKDKMEEKYLKRAVLLSKIGMGLAFFEIAVLSMTNNYLIS